MFDVEFLEENVSSISSDIVFSILVLMEKETGKMKLGKGFINLIKGKNKYFMNFTKGEEKLRMEFFFPEFEVAKNRIAALLRKKDFVVSLHPFYLKKEKETITASVYTVNGLESEVFHIEDDRETLLALYFAFKNRFYYKERGFFITEKKVTFKGKEILDLEPFITLFRIGGIK